MTDLERLRAELARTRTALRDIRNLAATDLAHGRPRTKTIRAIQNRATGPWTSRA